MTQFSYNPVPKPKHQRRVKTRGERSKFSKMVRDEVKSKYNNQCAMCAGKGLHVHHVMPRSRGGRNVFTNALLLCNDCHREVHAEDKLLRYWIRMFKDMYGAKFYKDKQDLLQEYHTEHLKETDREIAKWLRYNEKFEILRK